MKNFRKGFTLIELLLVIGIIAILAAIVIVAINPTRQLGQARNAQRNSDVNTLLNAVWQYAIDNSGNMPCDDEDTDGTFCETGEDTIDSSWHMIGDATSGCSAVSGTAFVNPAGATNYCTTALLQGSIVDDCLDLDSVLDGTYLVDIPSDPRYSVDTSSDYGFYVVKNAGNRITVRGCFTEATQPVFEVTR